MTARRATGTAVLLLPLLVVAVGCTDSAGTATAPSSTAASSPSSVAASSYPAPPTLAATAEAEVLSRLPAGSASGRAVVTYSGLGQLDEPFSGKCSGTGDTTRIEGAADTAQVRLEVEPEGADLTLEDIGLSATSHLAQGQYEVSGGHLSLDAPLVQARETIGSVRLEIDCG